MREVVKLAAFIFLIVGTLGLLITEFVSDWWGGATITFAVLNVVGLITLACINWGIKRT
jgi:hypothetical protein